MNAWTQTVCTSSCWIGLLLAATGASAQTPAKYRFEVVPQYNATDLHKDWLPLLARISRDTGITLELKLSPSIPKFEDEFGKGTPDFAYMNPYHAVMARQAQGYVPLVRDSKPLSGILLVRRDSPYQTVQDLHGLVIGFPAPNAFGASLYMRALLTENAKIQFETQYIQTHSNVFRHVVRGIAAAGGSVGAAFEDEQPELREQLRVIYQTPAVASHPIVAHPRVPERVHQAVASAFMALTADEAGQALLNAIRTPHPVAANYERDYLPLEKLKIQKYVVTKTDPAPTKP